MGTRRRTVAALAGAGLLAWAVGLGWADPAPPKAAAPAVKAVSGPFTHANLTVFLLHGPDVLPGKDILTLQDALAQKKAVVHETSAVNQLAVENTSDDAVVFIQSGDIVKGGKQDRAIAFDLLLPPKSGLVSVGSFCCEAGRWTKRGGEAADYFAESNAQVAGRDLKAAVVGNDAAKQGEVWKKVGETQQKLAQNVGKPVAADASPSSLQLTLENKEVQDKVAAYEKALAGCVGGKTDVIGVAVVVNGKVDGAEVYGSAALFGKLWPKVLKAAATDALARLDEKKTFEPATAKAVDAFLADAAAGAAREVPMSAAAVRGRPAMNPAGQPAANAAAGQRLEGQLQQAPANAGAPAAPPARVRIVRFDGSRAVLVECQDQEKAAVVHRCYIAKDPPKDEPKKP